MRKSLAIIATAVLSLAACTDATSTQSPTPVTDVPSAPATPSPTLTEPQPEASQITIVNAGDFLMNKPVNEAARVAGETYNYDPYFVHIKPYIANADVAFCMMEVPMVGPGEEPSGYPVFGAPWDLGQAVANIGFDGCNFASNHTMDRGFDGVTTTINRLEELGIGFTGAARSAEEASEIQFYTVTSGNRQVKIAHLGYTIHTNGLVAPVDKEWSWSVVGEFGQPYETIIDDARRARTLGADLVTVGIHWGVEYTSEPDATQRDIATFIAESGEVDVLYGGHTHSAQPIEKLAGGTDGDGMFVVWSHGNFLSGQRPDLSGWEVTTGLITTTTVDVPAEGSAHVSNVEWTGVTQDRPAGELLYPMWEFQDGDYPEDSTLSAEEIALRAGAFYPVMATSGAERTEPPTPVATALTLSRE